MLGHSNKMINSFFFKIDSTTFLQVGIDPNSDFQSMVQIFTKSRIITISPSFLNEIFARKKYISSMLESEEPPSDTDMFLYDYMAVWVYQRRNEKYLCIECLLRDYILRLTKIQFQKLCQYEISINQKCTSNNMVFKPIVEKQLEMLAVYFKNIFPFKKALFHEKMVKYAQLIEEKQLKSVLPTTDECFYGQIQFRASKQLVNRWIQLLSIPSDVSYKYNVNTIHII